MKAHITTTLIKHLKPADKPYEVVDDALKGFLALVQPSGVISFTFHIEQRMAPEGDLAWQASWYYCPLSKERGGAVSCQSCSGWRSSGREKGG